MLVNDARTVWRSLKGVISVYKPADISCNQIRKTIASNVCKELCELQCRPPQEYVNIVGDTSTKLTVTVRDNLADHPLVVGPRYQPQDLRCIWANFLGKQTSGILLFGLNDGIKLAHNISESKPTRAYRIHGKFGEATENYFKDGRVVEKSTFKHIKRYNIDRLLSSMQANHQKKMFELCGVDIQSQTAYELASKGLIRPSNSEIPVVYGIKCIYFGAPDFIIGIYVFIKVMYCFKMIHFVEVQCINEYEMYLKTLIHDIGMQMHATAHCTALQCIRHSYFCLEHALLQKHWSLQHILDNMAQSKKILYQHENIANKKQTANLQ